MAPKARSVLLHDNADHAEERVRCLIDHVEHHLSALAHRLQAESEEEREQQDLQNVAVDEGADGGRRNDVEQELDAVFSVRLGDVAGDRGCIDLARIDVHAVAGTKNIRNAEADDEGKRRHDLEINKGFDARAPDGLQIGHRCDAMHDRAEDDRRDDHLDQLDEGVTQRLHLHG